MEWFDSPCYRCESAACCSHLPLFSFTIDDRRDWEKGASLLRFPDIRLGLRSDGEFRVYLGRTCAFLTGDRRCLNHDTPRQSKICMGYSPHTCWYKRAFHSQNSDLLILLDSVRFAALEKGITWNEAGEVDRVADWEVLIELTAAHPLDIKPFRERERAGTDTPTALLMPPGKPEKREHWDLVRFRLGFPGVFLSRAVEEGEPWAFLISSDGEVPSGDDLATGVIMDPFATGNNPLKSSLLTWEGLNRREGI